MIEGDLQNLIDKNAINTKSIFFKISFFFAAAIRLVFSRMRLHNLNLIVGVKVFDLIFFF